jgi:hypothetical protein
VKRDAGCRSKSSPKDRGKSLKSTGPEPFQGEEKPMGTGCPDPNAAGKRRGSGHYSQRQRQEPFASRRRVKPFFLGCREHDLLVDVSERESVGDQPSDVLTPRTEGRGRVTMHHGLS